MKTIPTKEIWEEETVQNRSNSHKSYIYPQFLTPCPNIIFEESVCQKSDCLLKHILYNSLTKDKVKVDHAKISHIFSRNKNASTEQHNYTINLVFPVSEIVSVYIWRSIFFPDYTISHKLWKEDVEKYKNVIIFWTRYVKQAYILDLILVGVSFSLTLSFKNRGKRCGGLLNR